VGAVHLIAGLLDTQVLLWTLAADARLPSWLVNSLADDAGSFGVSDVSLWEIAIKRSTGRLKTPDDLPQVVVEVGFRQVVITREQVWAVRDLPWHHRDPFDRLLVAQAQNLGVALVTADSAVSAYDVAVLW
jgi:PIN domain nuclease of toxin-antitoxin system